ncbi:MAG: antibiotic biosynthesis monooxygenase [Acidobacteriales bacterium]|nr:antibiotic biosynthesis monooxygenase [Terriglobales bacterium]
MLRIVWEFVARPECAAEFERHYDAQGTWAQLFRRSPHYRETVLYRDRTNANRYLLIDVWESLDAFEAFKRSNKTDYEATDKACAALTLREMRLGYFEDLA